MLDGPVELRRARRDLDIRRLELQRHVVVTARGQLSLRDHLADDVGTDLCRLSRLAVRSDVLREVVAAHELLSALVATELKEAL